MNLIEALNIITAIIFLVSIIIVIYNLRCKRLFQHSGIFLLIVYLVLFMVAFSNILEYANITPLLDILEEYLEILAIPYFLLFVYSISSQNEIKKRKLNEKKLMQSLYEREILIKEIHHRIKNNLQMINSMISMQLLNTEDSNLQDYLNNTISRITALGILHRKIYKTSDLMHINLREYLYSIIDQLIDIYSSKNLNIEYDISDFNIDINMDTAIPCGLIFNEIVSNSLKYAFSEKKQGQIRIEIKQIESEEFQMDIADNGIGLPEDIDFNKNCGLGMQLIFMLVKQMNGNIKISRQNGTKYSITFKSVKKEQNRWQKSEL